MIIMDYNPENGYILMDSGTIFLDGKAKKCSSSLNTAPLQAIFAGELPQKHQPAPKAQETPGVLVWGTPKCLVYSGKSQSKMEVSMGVPKKSSIFHWGFSIEIFTIQLCTPMTMRLPPCGKPAKKSQLGMIDILFGLYHKKSKK